jgi:hypothetical protein
MPVCYQCRGIGEADTDPCPNDPPCKPYDVCGYRVTHCHHKDNTVEAPVKFSADDLDPKTMLLTALPKNGQEVRYTDAYRTWGKRREWKTARCIGADIDCWGDAFYILEVLSTHD